MATAAANSAGTFMKNALTQHPFKSRWQAVGSEDSFSGSRMGKIHPKIPEEQQKMPLLGGARAKDLPHGLPRSPKKSPKQNQLGLGE